MKSEIAYMKTTNGNFFCMRRQKTVVTCEAQKVAHLRMKVQNAENRVFI